MTLSKMVDQKAKVTKPKKMVVDPKVKAMKASLTEVTVNSKITITQTRVKMTRMKTARQKRRIEMVKIDFGI